MDPRLSLIHHIDVRSFSRKDTCDINELSAVCGFEFSNYCFSKNYTFRWRHREMSIRSITRKSALSCSSLLIGDTSVSDWHRRSEEPERLLPEGSMHTSCSVANDMMGRLIWAGRSVKSAENPLSQADRRRVHGHIASTPSWRRRPWPPWRDHCLSKSNYRPLGYSFTSLDVSYHCSVRGKSRLYFILSLWTVSNKFTIFTNVTPLVKSNYII